MTHVLNTAEGQTSGTVDTNQVGRKRHQKFNKTLSHLQKFYKPFNIKYKGLKLLDVSQANISIHFTEISDFIDEALQGGGKILVNCQKGVSRSSAAVLAYLMLRHNMTAVEALVEVGIIDNDDDVKVDNVINRLENTETFDPMMDFSDN